MFRAMLTANTPITNTFTLEQVIQKLELCINNLFRWFKDTDIKANADKCHQLVTTDTNLTPKIGEFDTENSKEEKLLGIKINTNPYFENPYFFTFQMLHALARMVNFVNLEKRRSLITFIKFIRTQFNYCPLIWMIHSRQLSNRISKVHETALR